MSTAARAAGILFVHDGRVLLLKRAGGDHAGTWALPAGKVEPGEDAETAARRETREECGYTYDGPLRGLWTTHDGFAAYGVAAPERFEPRLNEEHTQARWAPFDDLPQPLHPELAKALRAMPLIESKSGKARSENIKREIEAGKPPKQATAIAYSVQRKAQDGAYDAKMALDALRQCADACMAYGCK